MKQDILFFNVVLKERIWGGNSLAREYKQRNKELIGEAWILSGHKEGETEIINGNLKGVLLNDAYLKYKELFGTSNKQKFPLLIKIIDAKADLSVQVHPNNEYALKHHNDFGKNECWYVLDAKEDAKIVYGLNVFSKDLMKESIKNNKWDETLKYVAVKPGDFFYVPVGTVHALGSGTKILEIQQSSDVTYRLYDYDRKDNFGKKRELHINRALDVIDYNSQDQNSIEVFNNVERLVKSPYFVVDKITLDNKTIIINQNNEYGIIYNLDNVLTFNINGKAYKIEPNQVFIITALVKTFTVFGSGKFFYVQEQAKYMKDTYEK